MTQTHEEWGPWTEHDGTGRPADVKPGMTMQAVFEEEPGNFSPPVTCQMGAGGGYSWDWAWWGMVAPDGGIVARIIRYRVRQYRALADLKRIADVPQPVREREEVEV